MHSWYSVIRGGTWCGTNFTQSVHLGVGYVVSTTDYTLRAFSLYGNKNKHLCTFTVGFMILCVAGNRRL